MILVDENRNVIQHYGVIGMRWGVRKEREQRERRKATNVFNVQSKLGKDATRPDLEAAQWMKLKTSEKITRAIINAGITSIFSVALHQALYGEQSITPAFLRRVIAISSRNTAINVFTKDKMARKSMERYTSSGQRNKSKKQYKGMTPQEAVNRAVKVGLIMAPYLSRYAKNSVVSYARGKVEAQKRVESWGANILPKKTSEFHTIYDDGYMSVLEKIKG